MTKKRTVLSLTEDALSVIDENSTERTRGEFVSTVLVEWSKYKRNEGLEDVGLLERLEHKIDVLLARVETSES